MYDIPGQQLSVIWSNAEFALFSAEDGSCLSSGEMPASTSFCQSMTLNLLDPALALPYGQSHDSFLDRLDRETSADDGSASILDQKSLTGTLREALTAYRPDERLTHAMSDLPRELALINVEAELPPLKPLPKANSAKPHLLGSFDAKENAAAMCKPESRAAVYQNYVPCHLISGPPGRFIVDPIEMEAQIQMPSSSSEHSQSIVSFSTHPSSSCHAMVYAQRGDITSNENTERNGSQLGFQIVSFDAYRNSSYFYHYITRKVRRLSYCADYLVHVSVLIRSAWKAAQDTTSRLMQHVRQELEQARRFDLDTALYHQAVAGNFLAPVKEWLSDQLQERVSHPSTRIMNFDSSSPKGHKRWDKASTSAYETVINYNNSYLLPCLERMTVIASRLRGLSRTPDIAIFEIDESLLTRLIDDIDALRTIAYNVTDYAPTELTQFKVFSEWLGYQIDIASSEPSSQTAMNAAEKSSNIEYEPLLAYIQRSLLRSHLNFFLQREDEEIITQCDKSTRRVKNPLLTQILDRHYRKCLQPSGRDVEVVNVLYQGLVIRKDVDEIKETPRKCFVKHTPFSEEVTLDESADESVLDTRMVHAVSVLLEYTTSSDIDG